MADKLNGHRVMGYYWAPANPRLEFAGIGR
jgi:hypothetical protein